MSTRQSFVCYLVLPLARQSATSGANVRSTLGNRYSRLGGLAVPRRKIAIMSQVEFQGHQVKVYMFEDGFWILYLVRKTLFWDLVGVCANLHYVVATAGLLLVACNADLRVITIFKPIPSLLSYLIIHRDAGAAGKSIMCILDTNGPETSPEAKTYRTPIDTFRLHPG